jgi:hypothetical protein
MIAAFMPDSTAQPPIATGAPASPTVPLTLGYACSSAVEVRPRRWSRTIALLFVLPAAVTPFVPFVHSTSPLRVMAEVSARLFTWDLSLEHMLGLLAAPLFLGLPLILWHLRLLIASDSTRGERIILWSLSILSATASLMFLAIGMLQFIAIGGADREPMAYASAVSIIALGALMLMNPLARRLQLSREGRATLALSVAYLANAAMPLIVFARDYELGAWLTLAASVGIVALQGAQLLRSATTSSN